VSVKDLAQLITRRIIARAQQEPDPEYLSRAVARVMVLEHCPPERMESELLRFGREFVSLDDI
jgi:hypothetical protein